MRSIVRAAVLPLVVVTALSTGSLTATVPVASAAPFPDVVKDSGRTPPIALTQLGLSDRIDLTGANQSTDVSVPVPAGVAPTLLTGQIGSVVNVAGGRVDVLDARGLSLGSINVPANTASAPFTVKIGPAQVIGGKARLSFILRDSNATTNSCTQPPALTLSQLSATYSGRTPDPVTIADFLPGYLEQVDIRVGPKPTEAAQQAALNLVAELTALYRPMPVHINVIPSFDQGRKTSSSRVIDIRDGGRPKIAVERPGTPAAALAITGTGADLVRQVDLFTDQRLRLAQTASAVTLSAQESTLETSTNVKSFGELGTTGEASVLGVSMLYVGFDASAFGVGSISSARVHLKANYTPVVSGDASVIVRAGSTVLATHPLDNSGVLDVTGDIPGDVITSNVGMSLELRYIPRQECAPLNDRLSFIIDPRSTVTVTPGTNNRGGFPVLPMAFTPDFNVAVDSPEHINFAAQAINLIGQQTGVTLRPHVTTFADAAKTGTGLLVVTGSDELTKAGMTPPLVAGNPDTYAVNGSPQTEVDLNGPLGVVQAFTQNDRTVLAVTGDWSLVEDTFTYVRQLPNRWGSVTGDVIATGAAGDTINLTMNEGGSMAHQPLPSSGWQWWAWISIGIAAAAVAAGAVTLVIRRRSAKG